MKIVVFQGYRDSGKTRTIELLTRALAKSGKRVGTIKHIHEKKFTIDREGKDTWKHAKAGAIQVIALAPKEIAIIQKRKTNGMTADDILNYFKEEDFDYVFVEGLHKRFSSQRGIRYVVCAENGKEAKELLGSHSQKTVFITGKIAEHFLIGRRDQAMFNGVRILRMPKDVPIALTLVGAENSKER